MLATGAEAPVAAAPAAATAAPTAAAPSGTPPAAPAASPTATKAPGIDAFGRLPAIENVVVSPDGGRLAFVRTQGEARALAIFSLADRKVLDTVGVGDRKLRYVQWLDDRYLLVAVSTTATVWQLSGPRREWVMGFVYEVGSGKARPLRFETRAETTMNVMAGRAEARTIDGRTVLYARGIVVTDRTVPALFAVDPANGRTRIVARGSGPYTDWLVDENGEATVTFSYDERERVWRVQARRDGLLQTIAKGTAEIEIPELLGFGADGRSVVMAFVEDDRPVWKQLSLVDGTWSTPFPEETGWGAPLQERSSDRVVGYVLTGSATYRWSDPETQRRWDSVARAFGSARIELASRSADFRQIVVLADYAEYAPEYQIVDWSTKRSTPVGDVYPELQRIGERRPVTYTAADGLEIPGFLTLPPGREPKGLPLVVLPHGGPAAADTPGFDWWSQAYAAQGYAVLQPNFRGSSLDWEHLSAGFGEWGRKMQSDLSDGVRWLAAQGTIDPTRVCIAGGSYGGYAALAGVAFEPDVYRCAISVNGVSDLPRMLNWTDEQMGRSNSVAQRWWRRFMGVEGARDPKAREFSPSRRADAVRSPVLLIHGRDDTVVPFDQSERMADALRELGRPVELVALPREDHWLSRGETRTRMLQESVRFLREHNPP